ncbi:MAG: acylphosphatase [Pseudomonadota bacterium]
MASARRFIVKGRVQGVWFRDSTRREAQHLGITGSAVNLPDGDVLVHANGDNDALDALQQWLHDGPPLARVEKVIAEDVDATDTNTFVIG